MLSRQADLICFSFSSRWRWRLICISRFSKNAPIAFCSSYEGTRIDSFKKSETLHRTTTNTDDSLLSFESLKRFKRTLSMI